MSIRSRVARWLFQNQWDSSQITRGSVAWETLFGPASKLPVPTEQSALTVSAIYACTFLLSGVISSLPVGIYNMDAEGFREEVWGDDLWWMLNEQMTPRWSAAIAWEYLSLSLLLHGNAYAEIVRDGSGKPIGLRPVHPRRVTVLLDGLRDRLVYVIAPDSNVSGYDAKSAKPRTFDQDDIIHIPGFGFDGLVGLSPLQYALRMSGSVALATQDFAANFFANSARPDYALRTEKSLTPEQLANLKSSIDERHKSTEFAHRPMVLEGGLDIKEMSLPLEDLQLVQVRQFQVEEIARVFGVPPFMIGHNEKTTSWGSGVEAMGIGFVRYTLRPYLTKIENELNRKLIRGGSKLLAFNTKELERADMKSFYEGLRSGVGRAGERQLISVNEARKELRQKPVKGGDTVDTTAPNPSAQAPKDTQDAQSQAA
jgi:HK97 family phage portal protein